MKVKPPDDRAAAAPRGPFSRPLRIHDVPEKVGIDRKVEASAGECAAIAADTGLVAVAQLSADFHVARRPSGRFEVTGTLVATITETCVVSLEPFDTAVAQDVSVSFALVPAPANRDLPSRNLSSRDLSGRDSGADTVRGGERLRVTSAVDVDIPDDSPDPIVDNTIDLGAVAVEFLTLARDFYPKKPGVHFADVLIGENDEQDPSPFAALARFKDRS